MIVCSCHGISDREVRQAAREFHTASGAALRGCLAGTGCGGCARTIRTILEEERTRQAAARAAARMPPSTLVPLRELSA